MNRFSIDKDTIVFLYKKHKDYIIPIVTIIICFLLLVKITIPQLENLSVKRQEYKVEKDKLDVLNNNLKLLNSISTDTLESQFNLATSALPPEKNFTAVLDSVTLAANKSGVFLGDYEFQVGDLSKTPTIGKKYPSLQIALSVNGGVGGAVKFMNELYKSLPLSEISSIEISFSKSIITAVFYYKPFSGNIGVANALNLISKQDSVNLKDISTWNNPSSLELSLPQQKSSTSSATSPSFPF